MHRQTFWNPSDCFNYDASHGSRFKRNQRQCTTTCRDIFARWQHERSEKLTRIHKYCNWINFCQLWQYYLGQEILIQVQSKLHEDNTNQWFHCEHLRRISPLPLIPSELHGIMHVYPDAMLVAAVQTWPRQKYQHLQSTVSNHSGYDHNCYECILECDLMLPTSVLGLLRTLLKLQ